jgi:hypothetical protein
MEAFCMNHAKMWVNRDWMFLCDTALTHQRPLVQQQLTKDGTVLFPHLAYSANLSLCDFNPFPWMRDQLNCFHFSNAAGIYLGACAGGCASWHTEMWFRIWLLSQNVLRYHLIIIRSDTTLCICAVQINYFYGRMILCRYNMGVRIAQLV